MGFLRHGTMPVTDFNGIKQADQAHEEAAKAAKTSAGTKKNGNAFTNFSQSNMTSELDEMEKLFHKEVNGQ